MPGMTLSDLSKKMREIDFAMLSARAEGGQIAARPMSNNGQVEYDGDSFFFTDEDTHTVQDIRRDPNVGRQSLEALIATDPFAEHGLIEDMTVTEWDPIFVAFNADSSMPGSAPGG